MFTAVIGKHRCFISGEVLVKETATPDKDGTLTTEE
jgi:hypothetical protein